MTLRKEVVTCFRWSSGNAARTSLMSASTSLPVFREFEGFGLVRLAMGWDENSSGETSSRVSVAVGGGD